MKKVFIIAALLISSFACMAQESQSIVRNGNTFTEVKKPTSKGDTQTPFMYEIKDTIYPIWISKNGRCFILRVSKKSGKEYKQYLCEEVSREICKETGIEYKELK